MDVCAETVEKKSEESDDDQTGKAETIEISADEDVITETEADKSKLNDSSELLDTSASTVRDSSNTEESPSKQRKTDSSTPASTKKSSPSSRGTKVKPKMTEEKKKEKLQRRQEIKEQKERELQEKKEKREQELQEKKKKREEEKAAKEKAKEKKEKERLEKKEQVEKEKQEKLQQKEEEKKKKQELLEAKAEEKRKKEEEKRLKEDEKIKEEEEEARKKQLQQQVFSKFFLAPKAAPPKPTQEGTGWYMPFELRKGMYVAPSRRPTLTDEEKKSVEAALQDQVCTCLYFDQMKKGEVGKRKSSRTLPRVSLENDVELLSHDSEVVKKVTHHVKYLKFHENTRPPYYGTWRRHSKFVSPKNPFQKDQNLLDYEVDSDDEWEEEEPGESLSSSEDELDKDDDDKDDDEDEDGWMVPHGYLSEGEGCEDDEEVTPEMLKARRAAKVEAWEAEQKRKCQPVRAEVHGCYWEHESCSLHLNSVSFLQQFQAVCLLEVPISTSLRSDEAGEAGGDKSSTTPGSKGPIKKSVPEEAMPDLVRLVHGNECGMKKLVKEFRMYWRKKTSPAPTPEAGEEPMEVDTAAAENPTPATPQAESPATPGNTDAEEDGEQKGGFGMSKRQLEIRISSIAVRDRRPKLCKRMCWYVKDDILEKYGCTDLTLPNQWQYVSEVRKKKPAPEETASGGKTPSGVCADAEEEEPAVEETPLLGKPLPKDQRSIMDFARRLEQSELNKSKEEGGASREVGKEEEKDAVPSSSAVNAGKKKPVKAVPKDQPSIASFAKRAEVRSAPASTTQGEDGQGSTPGSVEVMSSKKKEGETQIEPILID